MTPPDFKSDLGWQGVQAGMPADRKAGGHVARQPRSQAVSQAASQPISQSVSQSVSQAVSQRAMELDSE